LWLSISPQATGLTREKKENSDYSELISINSD
jgi:hypothetical protein